MAYNGSSPLLQPGTLLAVPQAAAAGVKTQLTTEIGRRILRAVVNFGAYATDDAAGTYLGRNGKTNINYEQGVDAEVHANYGLELSAFPGRNSSNSSWIFHDLTVVFRALRAVANNGAASVGGGGQPACGGCAPPPLCAPPTTAHKSDDGDAAASVATSTIDNTQPRRDQHGNILNAHDGHVVGPVDGLYWLIGTSYTHWYAYAALTLRCAALRWLLWPACAALACLCCPQLRSDASSYTLLQRRHGLLLGHVRHESHMPVPYLAVVRAQPPGMRLDEQRLRGVLFTRP